MRAPLRTGYVTMSQIVDQLELGRKTTSSLANRWPLTPVLLEYLRCICEVYLRCIVFEAEESRKSYIDSSSRFRFVRARKGNKSLGKLTSPLGVLRLRGHEFGV